MNIPVKYYQSDFLDEISVGLDIYKYGIIICSAENY